MNHSVSLIFVCISSRLCPLHAAALFYFGLYHTEQQFWQETSQIDEVGMKIGVFQTVLFVLRHKLEIWTMFSIVVKDFRVV